MSSQMRYLLRVTGLAFIALPVDQPDEIVADRVDRAGLPTGHSTPRIEAPTAQTSAIPSVSQADHVIKGNIVLQWCK